MKHKIFLFAMLFMAISNINLYAESDTLWTTSIGSTVRIVKFSPDGEYVYAAVDGKGILKLNSQNGEILQEFEGFKYENEIHHNALDVSQDGKYILGGEYYSLYLFNSNDGSIIKQFETGLDKNQNIKFNDAKLSKDNKYVFGLFRYTNANNTNYSLNIWDLETSKLLNSISINMSTILEVSPNNDKLAYIGKQANSDNYDIALLEIGTWKEIGVLKGHTNRITDLSFSPDGSLLASCDFNYKMKIWDINKKELVFNNDNPNEILLCLELLNNNLIVLSSGKWEQISINSKEIISQKEIYSIKFHANDMEFYNNEKVILALGNKIALAKADKLTSIASDFTKDLIYPNPTTNIITIPKSYFEFGQTDISIVNISGVLLYQRLITDNEEHLIDVSKYPNATYYLNIKNSKMSNSMRFIKE